MKISFEAKTVVVSGAGQGLGRCIAEILQASEDCQHEAREDEQSRAVGLRIPAQRASHHQ